jgi:hypothetical protein
MGDRVGGSDAYLEYDGQSLKTSAKSLNITDTLGESDATTFSDTYKTSIPTKRTLEVSADVVVFTKSSAVGTAQNSVLTVGNEANLLWGQEGNAAGKPKGGAVMRLVEKSLKLEVEGTAMWSCKWQRLFDETTDVWS